MQKEYCFLKKSSEINECQILSLNQKIFYDTFFIGSLLRSSIWPFKKLRFQSSKLNRKRNIEKCNTNIFLVIVTTWYEIKNIFNNVSTIPIIETGVG